MATKKSLISKKSLSSGREQLHPIPNSSTRNIKLGDAEDEDLHILNLSKPEFKQGEAKSQDVLIEDEAGDEKLNISERKE